MLNEGSILHGLFHFPHESKNKYAIILHKDEDSFITTTFTTSQRRHPENPRHGANPKNEPICHVFLAGKSIGLKPDGQPFAFSKNTTIVPDYGVNKQPIDTFKSKVTDLTKVCDLYENEYEDLLYTLYKCDDLQDKYRVLLEQRLFDLAERKSI